MRIPANRMPTAAAYRPDSRDAGIRRYFGLVQFALIVGVPASRLCSWRHGTHIWVPSPDIQVGDQPGWSMACIDGWVPGSRRRPVPAAASCAIRRHRRHQSPLPRDARLHVVGVHRRRHYPPAGRVGRQPTGLAVVTCARHNSRPRPCVAGDGSDLSRAASVRHDETVFAGNGGSFGSRRGTEFGEDARYVHARGIAADEQLGCDLAIAQPLCDQT